MKSTVVNVPPYVSWFHDVPCQRKSTTIGGHVWTRVAINIASEITTYDNMPLHDQSDRLF